MFVFMVMLKIIRKTSAGTNRSTKNLACYVFLKQIKTQNNFELMIYLRCDAKLSVTLIFCSGQSSIAQIHPLPNDSPWCFFLWLCFQLEKSEMTGNTVKTVYILLKTQAVLNLLAENSFQSDIF